MRNYLQDVQTVLDRDDPDEEKLETIAEIIGDWELDQ